MTSGQVARKLDNSPLQKPELKGLCTTCMQAEGCTYPRNEETGVLFCEEFEVVSAPKFKIVTPTQNPSTLESNLKGLCANCNNALLCQFPKPDSGVWHCEEYA